MNQDTNACPTCGHHTGSKGLEHFLGKLGISDDMISKIGASMDNAELDEYLGVAREYLRTGSNKAVSYAKEHPGKVAAGVAAIAIGTGVLINAVRN